MKINWGTAIVIAFVCFISFIMYFVISMSTNKKYEHDLVVEDYYQQELKFQSDIDKETNSKSLETNVSWTKTAEGIQITFPKDLDIKKVRRSAANYMEQVTYEVYENFEDFESKNKGDYYFITRYGQSAPDQMDFKSSKNDTYVIFGSESSGIPKDIFMKYDELKALGLDIPYTVKLQKALEKRGIIFDDCILTLEDMRDMIASYLSKDKEGEDA